VHEITRPIETEMKENKKISPHCHQLTDVRRLQVDNPAAVQHEQPAQAGLQLVGLVDDGARVLKFHYICTYIWMYRRLNDVCGWLDNVFYVYTYVIIYTETSMLTYDTSL
jgi:hypothetical protein